MSSDAIHNFGRNVEFSPTLRLTPQDAGEVVEILNRVRGRSIRVGGRLHSWSPAAASDDVYLDLRRLNEVAVSHDAQGPFATIGAGCQIKRVLKELARQGLTLPALGLISEQAIAGAISTATHGSGRHCFSHYVSAVHIAHYDAESDEAKISVIREREELRAAQCSLGCLGVIVAVEMRVRAAYQIEEFLRFRPRLEDMLAAETETPLQQFFYLPWYDGYLGQHRRETEAPRSWLARLYRVYWFVTIDVMLHLWLCFCVRRLRSSRFIKAAFRYLTPAGVIRNWHVVDRSDAMLIMEHELFRHIEIELFVTRTHLPAALMLARQLIRFFDSGDGLESAARLRLEELGLGSSLAVASGTYTHHYPVCVRRVLPDETLLSMTSGGAEDFYALSFISYAWPSERRGFFLFAKVLARALTSMFGARCHWGKVNPHTAEEVESLYPQLPAFRAVQQKYDRQGRFQNEWVSEVLFSGPLSSSDDSPTASNR